MTAAQTRIETQEDLADFATRADLAPLATKADLADFATRKDLRTEIAGVRADMKADFATRADLRAEIAEAETRLVKEIAGVESRLGKEITDVRADLRWIIRIGGGIFAVLLVLVWFAARSAF
ncbi:MAG: hypothetical protein GDA52_04655 [Rhodobacteraceae bacterium]|nr:hypothetical protein [Paracoccaceae bacterium]